MIDPVTGWPVGEDGPYPTIGWERDHAAHFAQSVWAAAHEDPDPDPWEMDSTLLAGWAGL